MSLAWQERKDRDKNEEEKGARNGKRRDKQPRGLDHGNPWHKGVKGRHFILFHRPTPCKTLTRIVLLLWLSKMDAPSSLTKRKVSYSVKGGSDLRQTLPLRETDGERRRERQTERDTHTEVTDRQKAAILFHREEPQRERLAGCH